MTKSSVSLYSNGELNVKDSRIYFKEDYDIEKIMEEEVKEIYVFGEVRFDKKFLEHLSKAEISMHLFNYYGYYSGTFYPQSHRNSSDIVLKQVEYYLDYTKRLPIAKVFVNGAVKNILQVLKYYKNRGKDLKYIENSIEELGKAVYTSNNVNELMAIEGNIRNYYYQAFDIILNNPDFIFDQRSKRPPRNHLNTLISFGNSMIYTVILGQIYRTHLDPRIGYLHSTNYRRYTLNLDVAEIFKPIIVDRVIFTVINKKIITQNDFEALSEGIMLKDRGREKFIEQFDKKLDSLINHKEIREKISYRELIEIELKNLEEHFINGKEYNTFISDW